MDFLKKHYEKIILGLVLIGVLGALVSLPFVIKKDEDDMTQMAELVIPPGKDLPPLDLSMENNALARMQSPFALDLATTNKLFNPVTWKKNEAGELFKVTTGNEIDAHAAVVTNITPLNLILTLENVDTNAGVRYMIGITHQAATTRAGQAMHTHGASLNEKGDLFTITQVKGDPTAPDQLMLKLMDSGETVSISKGKPYERPDAYMADLRFDPEKKAFHKVRVDSILSFGGDSYKIVAINQDEVKLEAQSNQKMTVLHYAR